MTIAMLFGALLLLALGYSVWKGGAPERIGAMILLAGYLLSISMVSTTVTRFMHVEMGIMIVDAAMLLCLLFLALYADRYWTLWLCAMQVIQVLTHLPILLIPELLPRAYAILIGIWSLPMILILVAGTWRHRQRVRRFGTDKSWSSS